MKVYNETIKKYEEEYLKILEVIGIIKDRSQVKVNKIQINAIQETVSIKYYDRVKREICTATYKEGEYVKYEISGESTKVSITPKMRAKIRKG